MLISHNWDDPPSTCEGLIVLSYKSMLWDDPFYMFFFCPTCQPRCDLTQRVPTDRVEGFVFFHPYWPGEVIQCGSYGSVGLDQAPTRRWFSYKCLTSTKKNKYPHTSRVQFESDLLHLLFLENWSVFLLKKHVYSLQFQFQQQLRKS